MTDSRDPSRRDFLATSAIGLIGLARGAESLTMRDYTQARGDLLYVGTYTDGTKSEGIYLVRMDRMSGELRRVGAVDAGPNPSFLAIHPNGRVLYAVNELEKYKERPTGAVSAFEIASVIPRSLKEPVGLSPSTLSHTCPPVTSDNHRLSTRGVPPSRSV